jgi:hypothetical protein
MLVNGLAADDVGTDDIDAGAPSCRPLDLQMT